MKYFYRAAFSLFLSSLHCPIYGVIGATSLIVERYLRSSALALSAAALSRWG
ncbi:MAG: hypothetical protein M5U34_29070 [Chloroflexi bacterium]|nr:hypothetical protein [Chloroflexota bacterium]